MAFSVTQATAQFAGTGATLDATFSATAIGSMVVLHVGLRDLNETCTSVTDDVGNTYTLLGPIDQSTNVRMYHAYGRQVIGGATVVTATFSGAVSNKGSRGEEYATDDGGTIAFDASTTGTGLSTAISASMLVPDLPGELIVSGAETSGSITWTAGSGYTLNGAGTVFMMSEYQLAGDVSELGNFTVATNQNWSVRVMAFKSVPYGFSVALI